MPAAVRTAPKVSIVMAEDHHVVRHALRLLLEKQTQYEIVAESGDGIEAVELCERFSPTVLVTDLMIPRLHGLDVVRQVCDRCPKTRIIILSMREEAATVAEAFRNGAMGYVLKEASAKEFLDALSEVLAGRRYVSSKLRGVIDELGYGHRAGTTDIYASLTPRERLVLELAAEGLSSPEIARRLYISVRTAETHRSNFMRKLHIKSQTDLVRFAIRKGIIRA